MNGGEATTQNWTNKISNSAQLGGIETAFIDNGIGRGTRIAWINTGTGLRYKVVIDRAMDIADAFYNQHSLAWLSHLGITPPQPFSDQGIEWLRTFGGGLLTTCGLSHIGGPESDDFGTRGLHGQISNIPAEIESIIQPDPLAGKMEMSITGIIKQTRIFGPALELRRTISGTLGEPTIRIHDEVLNRGNTVAPHMLLYHFNFGWPLVDEGTEIVWQGNWQSRDGDPNNPIFREGNDFRSCHCGIRNAALGIELAIRFQKSQLPWMTNWQHWGKGEYVTGIEPGTNPPIGQAKARERNTLIQLAPGERRTYDLEIEVLEL
jgi:Domain of unknown function (DUF4432)